MTPSYRTLTLAAVLLVASMEVAGMFARYTEEQLIENSDLIVVGTLIGRTTLRVAPDAAELTLGVLAIDDRLKGEQAESVALLLLPAPGPLIASDTISYEVGQQGLWFLRLQQQGARGLYLADHPQRFEPMTGIAGRVAAVKKLIAETD